MILELFCKICHKVGTTSNERNTPTCFIALNPKELKLQKPKNSLPSISILNVELSNLLFYVVDALFNI